MEAHRQTAANIVRFMVEYVFRDDSGTDRRMTGQTDGHNSIGWS